MDAKTGAESILRSRSSTVLDCCGAELYKEYYARFSARGIAIDSAGT